jgi:hypothetical protein
MTVGVDARSNALIVTAPEPLFLQVKALVEQIDQPGSPDSDVVSIVPIKVSDPEVVKKALGSLMTTQTSTRTTSGQSGGGAGGPSAGEVDQRMEFLRRLRESGGFGGGGPPGFGGGPPGGDDGRSASGHRWWPAYDRRFNPGRDYWRARITRRTIERFVG